MNQNGTLILHANPQLTYTSDQNDYCGQAGLAACSLAVSTVPYDGTPRVLHVLAAFPDTALPRLKAMAWGVAYDPAKVVIAAHGPCGAGEFDIPDNGWPGNGTGIGQSWTATRTSILNEIYWFAAYAYGAADTTSLRLTPHPLHGGVFVDDSAPPVEDLIAEYGWIGFGSPGALPCPSKQSEDNAPPEIPEAEGYGEPVGDDEPQTPEDGSPGGLEPSVTPGTTFLHLALFPDSLFHKVVDRLHVEFGIRPLILLPPRALICHATEAQIIRLRSDPSVVLAVDEPLDTSPSTFDDHSTSLLGSWNHLFLPEAPDLGDHEPYRSPAPLRIDACPGMADPAIPYGSEWQNSPYLCGKVILNLVWVEGIQVASLSTMDGYCGATPDTCIYDWGEAAKAFHRGEYLQAILHYENEVGQDPRLSFELPEDHVFASREPMCQSNELWIHEAYTALGFQPADSTAAARIQAGHAFNAHRRLTRGGDSAVTFFMLRGDCDPDGTFGGALAYVRCLYGPFAVANSKNGPEFLRTHVDKTIAHELLHFYGAADEYYHCDNCREPVFGYMQAPNLNCEDAPCTSVHNCVMRGVRDTYQPVCIHTKAQIGWGDRDDDGIIDCLDHPDAPGQMPLYAVPKGSVVDIYRSMTGEWVKRIGIGSSFHSDGVEARWDGMDYHGVPLEVGSRFDYRVNGTLTGTQILLRPDLLPPEFQNIHLDMNIVPDSHRVTFGFTDLDSYYGRVLVKVVDHETGEDAVPRPFNNDLIAHNSALTGTFYLPWDGTSYDCRLLVSDIGGDHTAAWTVPLLFPQAGVEPGRHLFAGVRAGTAFPNPARGSTSVTLAASAPTIAHARVVGVDGRQIRDFGPIRLETGNTRLHWDGLDERGRKVPSGMYFVVLDSDGTRRPVTRRVVVVE